MFRIRFLLIAKKSSQLTLFTASKARHINIEGRLSTEDSPLQAWVIPVEEGLQIAHEICQTLAG
jgi:hypothetical protein